MKRPTSRREEDVMKTHSKDKKRRIWEEKRTSGGAICKDNELRYKATWFDEIRITRLSCNVYARREI